MEPNEWGRETGQGAGREGVVAPDSGRRPLNSDIIGGALGLALAGLFWLAREQWSFWSAVFPNLTLGILAALSLGLVIKGFLKPEMLVLLSEGNRVRILVTAVVLLLWAFGIRTLGTLLSSGVAFYGLTLYLASAGQRIRLVDAFKWLLVVIVEIGALYLIFSRVLGVSLPRGIWL
ncbi:MAG: tripartite tricarboxylate transporter TctB family protein [Trueperaceae bacterium]